MSEVGGWLVGIFIREGGGGLPFISFSRALSLGRGDEG